MPDDVKTYVLVGAETNAQEVALYSKNKNVIVLNADSGESLQDTIKRIQPPANHIGLQWQCGW